MQFDKTKHSAKYRLTLSNALHFTESDLTANQQGIITDSQANRLKMRLLFWSILFALSVLLSVFIVPFFTVIILSALLGTSDFSSPPFSMEFLVLIIAAIWFFTIWYYFMRLQQINYDIKKRRAASIEGRVHLSSSNSRNGTYYYATVTTKCFEIDGITFSVFNNEEPYIFYYAAYCKRLLSAEWLNDDPFLPE